MLSLFRKKSVTHWLSVSCLLYIILNFSLPGCASLQIRDNIFSSPEEEYTVHIPEKGWEPVKTSDADMVLWNKQYNAMIALISSDRKSKEFSLEMLNKQLFIGMKDKEIFVKESVVVGNQKAIHTILTSKIDDYTLKIDSYVIETDNKIYDLMYWAPLDLFHYAQSDFENMVETFKYNQL
ncbi:conserved hypothetical protein [Candidatus Jettenia caeni]|uniref:PsbP C-terminal domain-containing protein n=1 Tax=Candidatus Jettenia caeni TaxID=247490 RepID=I3IJ76_9BACT|nr:conserved hypothetical protein [Candidatus Jettenia caeni]GIL20437.1 MAG: hypothetical protein BroJett041_15510 [Candidatus Jettenia caeni]GJQ45406.1 MAG: hypothetical protein JETCAE04_11600 [Candidatus Jettenia caeni]